MAKVNWEKLDIIEQWTPIDPSDPNAVQKEIQNIKQLSALILKAFRRYKLEEFQKLLRRNKKAQARKVGIAA